MCFFILTIPFIVKKLYLLPFSSKLHFLNKVLNTFHIEILKIGKHNKFVNLLLYESLIYKLLRLISPYQEF